MVKIYFTEDNKAYIKINGNTIYIDKCLQRSKLKSIIATQTKRKKPRNVKRPIVQPIKSPYDSLFSELKGVRPIITYKPYNDYEKRNEIELAKLKKELEALKVPVAPPGVPVPVNVQRANRAHNANINAMIAAARRNLRPLGPPPNNHPPAPPPNNHPPAPPGNPHIPNINAINAAIRRNQQQVRRGPMPPDGPLPVIHAPKKYTIQSDIARAAKARESRKQINPHASKKSDFQHNRELIERQILDLNNNDFDNLFRSYIAQDPDRRGYFYGTTRAEVKEELISSLLHDKITVKELMKLINEHNLPVINLSADEKSLVNFLKNPPAIPSELPPRHSHKHLKIPRSFVITPPNSQTSIIVKPSGKDVINNNSQYQAADLNQEEQEIYNQAINVDDEDENIYVNETANNVYPEDVSTDIPPTDQTTDQLIPNKDVYKYNLEYIQYDTDITFIQHLIDYAKSDYAIKNKKGFPPDETDNILELFNRRHLPKSYNSKTGIITIRQGNKGNAAMLERYKQQLEHEQQVLKVKLGGGSVDKEGLSNFQIDKLMKKYGSKYLGCISADEIPKIIDKIKPQSTGGFIINTDPSNKPGKHWRAIYFDGNKDMEIDHFDSFGDPPSKSEMRGIKQIADKLGANGYLKFKNNKVQLQNDRTSNCGFFAAKFLIDRFNGKHFQHASGWNDAVKDNSTKGEAEIMKFRKQVGYGTPWSYIKSFPKKVYDVGKEVVNRITTAITGRTHAPPQVRHLLEKHGNAHIVGIEVARSPVQKVITYILNAISGGELEKNRKSLHYDQIYHLYLIITLDDGHSFKIERNQSVTVSGPSVSSDSEVVNVPVSNNVTLNEFIANGSKDNPTFWQYNWQTSNCQMFVRDLLQGSGLLTGDLSNFIMQDASGLLKNSPLTQKIADLLPDIGSKLEILIHGAARKKRKLTCRDLIIKEDKKGHLSAKLRR